MENGAYGRYPLLVRIPRTEMHGSTVGLRYTEYIIEVDDCGKVYTRSRRYTMFAWLHSELRQRELACALPELPPKKVLGNRESAFVERRRQMLEDYLKALLLLPAVIQDGMIWAFLDADEATAVVPRFLCRHATHPAAEKCLGALKRAVADQKEEVFRLCDATVLEELAKFARAEAAEAVAGQQMQVRLKNRAKLCFILYKVICYDRARHKLVQSDVFGALLALLCRVTDDEAELTSENSLGVTRCVKRLIQETNGEALLHFCQQEGAVNALRALASSPVSSLHTLCAWVLWFGLRCPGVVTALAGAGGTRGLFLLGDLLKSQDICARVLARLCIGWIVRQEGALDADAREYCLQALAPLAAELDAEELSALRRALETGGRDKCAPASRIIERQELWDGLADFLDGRSLDDFDLKDRQNNHLHFPLNIALREAPQPSNVSASDRQGEKRTSLSSSAETLEAPQERLELQRDVALVKTLAEICGRQELARLQVLLGEGEELDTVTAAIVAILDHFVLQGDEDLGEPEAKSSARGSKVAFNLPSTRQDLQELQVLIPQLEMLVKVGGEHQMVRGGGGGAADQPPNAQVSVEEVRVRAARILVRVKGIETPNSLIDLGSRACILEVLMRDAEALQANALDRLAQTRELCEAQHSHIVQGSLSEDPCVHQSDLQGFKQRLRDLTKHRGSLRYEVEHFRGDLEAMDVQLEQRGIKHGILSRDVAELCKDFDAKEDEYLGSSGILSELQELEELHQERLGQVEQLRAYLRDVEVRGETAAFKEAEAKAFVEQLRGQEEELETFCHTAPAKLQQCQCRLDTVCQQKSSYSKRRQDLSLEVDRADRRRQALQSSLEEARHALQSAGYVGKELEALKATINSELIMTDAEVAQLKELEAQLPAKPARLRRRSGTEEDLQNETATEVPSEGAPHWDDQAEKEFHQDLHFRALRKLRDERQLRWTEEERWLQESLQRVEESISKLRAECSEAEGQERQMQSDEDHLRKEVISLNDPEGHLQRLADARAQSAQAALRHEELYTAWAEAHGAGEMGREQLKQAEDEVAQVLPRLEAARAKATDNEEASKKVRQELQARFVELERRARDFLQEWRGLEKKEQSLAVRQERVDQSLRSEAEGRQGLRAEVQELIGMLQQLDQQLVQP